MSVLTGWQMFPSWTLSRGSIIDSMQREFLLERSARRRSRSPFRRLTGKDNRGPLFSQPFLIEWLLGSNPNYDFIWLNEQCQCWNDLEAWPRGLSFLIVDLHNDKQVSWYGMYSENKNIETKYVLKHEILYVYSMSSTKWHGPRPRWNIILSFFLISEFSIFIRRPFCCRRGPTKGSPRYGMWGGQGSFTLW